MKHPTCSLLTLCLPVVLAAQDPRDHSILENARSQFVLVQRDNGVLLGLGARYTARFLDDRVEIVPATPISKASTPVVLRNPAIGRGGALIPLGQAAPPRESGTTVRYARGSVTETYEVRTDGVEQSFVFETLPPGDGDLVVAMQLETSLVPEALSDDLLVFRSEDATVSIGGVVGVDADGHRVAGSLAFDGHALTLRLPSSFVENAALPLILDPLITSTTVLGAGGETMSAAYDVSNDSYLVVWSQIGGPSGTSPMEIRGWFEPGGAVLIDSDGVLGRPVVADCNARDCFVVVWAESAGLFARGLRSPTQLGSTKQIAVGNGTTYASVGIANNASSSSDRMLIAARVIPSTGSPSCGVFSLRVSTMLDVGAAAMTTVSGSGGLNGAVGPVSIAKSGGASGQYLVAWGQSFGGSPTLRSRLCAETGATLSPEATRAVPGIDLTEVSADGQDGSWVIAIRAPTGAYPAPGWGGWAYLVGVDLVAPAPLRIRNPVVIVGHHGARNLEVALAGRRAVVGMLVVLISRCISSSGQCVSSRLASFTLTDCLPCQAAEEVWQLDNRTSLVRPGASGDPDPAHAEEVRAFAWTASGPAMMTLDNQVGLVTDLGGACGGATATARAECAKTGGTHAAVLQGVTTASWLLIGTDRIDMRGCGSCVLVPDPFTSVVLGPVQSDMFGYATRQFAIPDLPGMVGVEFLQQWLISDSSTAGCASFPFSFSNALRVQIQ